MSAYAAILTRMLQSSVSLMPSPYCLFHLKMPLDGRNMVSQMEP